MKTVIILIIAAAAVLMFWSRGERRLEERSGEELIRESPTEVRPPVKQPETEEASTAAEERGMAAGWLEGSLSYPSSFIPEDMTVCAENMAGGEEICVRERITGDKYIYKIGYKLELPAGKYQVYSRTEAMPGYKAYYSRFVTCGLEASCPSHEIIEVEVKSGEGVDGIDPIDWYNQ